MSLWQRPSGIYESHITIDGVRYRKSTGTSNRRLAERIDRKNQEELMARRFQVEEHEFNPSMKFAELATHFLAAGSKLWHRERLKVVLPYFAGIEIGHISKSVVDRYRAHRHSEKKVTDSTINHDLQCLRHILYWAEDQGYLPENPLKRLKLEKPRRKKRPVMSLEDEVKLLRAAAPHLQRIVICALDTGMRRGEILSQLLLSTSGPATATVAKLCLSKSEWKAATALCSLTRATASMPASGTFQTHRLEAHSPATLFMSA